MSGRHVISCHSCLCVAHYVCALCYSAVLCEHQQSATMQCLIHNDDISVSCTYQHCTYIHVLSAGIDADAAVWLALQAG